MSKKRKNRSKRFPLAITQPAVLASSVIARRVEAYERALPDSQALDRDKLVALNLDIETAIVRVNGALPYILQYRARASALPEFDIRAFDELGTYVLALTHAHNQYRAASAPPQGIRELNEQALRLRAMLCADALALAAHELLPGDRIRSIKSVTGYQNIAFALMALTELLRAHWPAIAGKTPITPAHLDEAHHIGAQIIDIVGARQHPVENLAQVADQRRRNFTLFVRAYEEVRRALMFLRFRDGDWELIAPSLYGGRGNSNARKKAKAAEVVPVAPVDATHAGDAGGVGTPAPVASGFLGSSPFQ